MWVLLRNKNKWEFHYFFKVSLKFHRHQCPRSIIASVMYKVSLKGVSLRLPRPRNMPSHEGHWVPIVQIFLSLAATMLHKLLIGNHGQFILRSHQLIGRAAVARPAFRPSICRKQSCPVSPHYLGHCTVSTFLLYRS